MADDLLTSLCSPNSMWWNTLMRSTPAVGSPHAPICSGSIGDIAGLFSDSPLLSVPDFGLPSPTIDWNDPLICGRVQNNSSSHAQQLQEQQLHKPFYQKQVQTSNPNAINGMQLSQPSYPSSFLQGLVMDHTLNNSSQQAVLGGGMALLPDLPQYSHVGSPTDLPGVNVSSSGYYAPVKSQFHEENTSSSSSSSGGKRKVTKKSTGKETAPKKPRIQMPSPLPTFHVRKEKLQDRVTALQQLVAPFGKTDTASVLNEAIEYIRFLHDQVKVLSAPYMKAGHPIHNQQNPKESKPDLRSRGLCMVPISSTFAIAQEPIADFCWSPNFIVPFK